MYLTGQILGVIGFIFCLIGFLQKEDRQMKMLIGISSSIVAVSYYLIGAHKGAAILTISAIRNFVSISKYIRRVFPLFVICYLVAAIISYKYTYDILPITGSLISTIGLSFYRGINLRRAMICTCALWLTYNIITFSIGGMLMEGFNIIVSFFAIRKIKLAGKVRQVKSE